MQLTTAQLQTLKAWVIANANSVFDLSTANLLNAPASPAFRVYRKFVPMQEVMGNNFDWTRVDNLNVGKARIWEYMERAYASGAVGGLNFANSACRTGINTVWVGTQQDLAVRASVYSHATRDATVAEKLLKASGDGNAPDANGDGPATLGDGAEGPVTLQNLVDAANS